LRLDLSKSEPDNLYLLVVRLLLVFQALSCKHYVQNGNVIFVNLKSLLLRVH